MNRGGRIIGGGRAGRMIFAGCCVVLLLIGSGCSDKKVPSGILPQDKMESVIWDMAQADQYATLYLAKDSAHIDRKMETLRLYEEVFRLHQVSREQFRKSYQYYLEHPALNQLLFDSVIMRGVRARTESYDRPVPYHPPVVPVPGAPGRKSGVPGAVGAAGVVGKGGVAGALPGAVLGNGALQSRNAFLRARDSAARVHHGPVRTDTIRKHS